MLATFPPTPPPNPSGYAPRKPSPLSPRHLNASPCPSRLFASSGPSSPMNSFSISHSASPPSSLPPQSSSSSGGYPQKDDAPRSLKAASFERGSGEARRKSGGGGNGTTRAYKPLPATVVGGCATTTAAKGREDGAARRREMFLRKVRREREEERWRARGGDDEILRGIYISERRRWEQRQAALAREWEALVTEEDDMDEAAVDDEEGIETELPDYPDQDAEMLDCIEQFQDEDLDALVARSAYPTTNEHPATTTTTTTSSSARRGQGPSSDSNESSVYGSDDGEFDRIFQEVLSSQEEEESAYMNAFSGGRSGRHATGELGWDTEMEHSSCR